MALAFYLHPCLFVVTHLDELLTLHNTQTDVHTTEKLSNTLGQKKMQLFLSPP